MSPEQVAGKPIDRRSDIFSLAIVLYELLTGKRLFLGKTDVETLEKIRKAEVPAPSLFNSTIPKELDEIILRALSKDLEYRYQWASEFGDDLKKFLIQKNLNYSRKDLMDFMSDYFSEELSEEKDKLERFKNMKVPEELHNQGTQTSVKALPQNTSMTMIGSSGSKLTVVLLTLILTAILFTAGWFVLGQAEKKPSKLLIDSSVKETIIEIDEGSSSERRCQTPCQIEEILPGQHIVSATAQGYLPQHETITILKGQTTRKVFKMIETGVVNAIVTIKTDPHGAFIFVNNEKVEETTPAVLTLPVGPEIVIRTEKPGYIPVEKSIGKLKADITKKVEFWLKKRPDTNKPKKVQAPVKVVKRVKRQPTKKVVVKKALLRINTRPWSNIYIDGKLIKSTPIYDYPVSPGRHTIRFENRRFKIDETMVVDLIGGQTRKIIKRFN